MEVRSKANATDKRRGSFLTPSDLAAFFASSDNASH